MISPYTTFDNSSSLYLTDMLCSSYPETEPACPVLWVNYGKPPGDWNHEPWGERIDIGIE